MRIVGVAERKTGVAFCCLSWRVVGVTGPVEWHAVLVRFVLAATRRRGDMIIKPRLFIELFVLLGGATYHVGRKNRVAAR